MAWIQNTLLSSLLALVAYQLVQQQNLQAQLHNLQQQQHETAGLLAQTLEPVGKQVESVQASVDKLVKGNDEATNQLIKKVTMRSSLVQALADVTQADLLRTQQQGKEAAEKLKSTKKVIWTAGDFFTAHKTRLQNLMTPIDKLVGSWQGGDMAAPAESLRKELNAVLGELNND